MTDIAILRSTASLMTRIARRVDEFLTDLADADPNALDGVELERGVVGIVSELGVALMKEVFDRADESSPEVVVNGERWGNRRVTTGTYFVKFGSFTADRATYQQSGRGRVLIPVDLRLGVVEGKYSPGLARLMARTIAEMPAERGEAYLKEVGVGIVSSSTLHRIPQDMSAVYEQDRVDIDAVVRAEWRAPAGTHTVQVGMDGVMVPMDGEHTKPRGRRTETPELPRHERHHGPPPAGPADSDGKGGAPYHEASVGTLACFDVHRNHLATIYLARMPEHRKETLAADLEAELTAVLEEQPKVRVVFASDGALTHWEHLEAIRERLPEDVEARELLDFYHGAGHLFRGAAYIEEDEGAAKALAGKWRSQLRHRRDGPDLVLRALRYYRDRSTKAAAYDELDLNQAMVKPFA